MAALVLDGVDLAVACDLCPRSAFLAAGETPRHSPILVGTFLDEGLREIGLIP
jgi:hypothetical protein